MGSDSGRAKRLPSHNILSVLEDVVPSHEGVLTQVSSG